MVAVGCVLLFLSAALLVLKQLPIVRAQNHYVVTLINLIMKSGCAAGGLCLTPFVCPFKRLIFWLGTISYALYLVHGYFMFFMADNVLGSYGVNSLVMLVISFASAALLHVIIKRLQKYKTLS